MNCVHFCAFLVIYVAISLAKPPNIVFILTDDQDVYLGSLNAMNKTKALIGEHGITFTNMFVTNPLCCPSRSSILTGRYTHNGQAVNNTISGNCSSPSWQKDEESRAFPTFLKKAGYRTFFAGKYLNQYGKKPAGGVEHVPPGWDEWIGLVGNSRYYNYTLSHNGKEVKHADKYPDDYLTAVIGKNAAQFVESTNSESAPFFMMLSTPACHAPFTPAPQYKDSFANHSAPRTPNFGVHTTDHHWLINQATNPMSKSTIITIDNIHRNRLRTLLSVDDIVGDLVGRLTNKGLLNNTYIILTGDNGYHLGQFNMPNDKRQLYESDIRVPLLIRGPGVPVNLTRDDIVLNIDFASTFLDLAGVTPPDDMDGRSIKPLLVSNGTVADWRADFMVEHLGEGAETNPGCPQYDHQQMAICELDCTCEDSANNSYGCVRVLSKTQNLVYCQFTDNSDFVEVYDVNADPHQLKNIADTIDPKVLVKLSTRLVQLAVCSGPTCRSSGRPYSYHGYFYESQAMSYINGSGKGPPTYNTSRHQNYIEIPSIEVVGQSTFNAGIKLDVLIDSDDSIDNDASGKFSRLKAFSFAEIEQMCSANWKQIRWTSGQIVKWFSNMGYLAFVFN